MTTTDSTRTVGATAYLDLLARVEMALEGLHRVAASAGHVAFTVRSGARLTTKQEAAVRRFATDVLTGLLDPDVRPVADVTFTYAVGAGAPEVCDVVVAPPRDRHTVLDAAGVDATAAGTAPLPVALVPRLQLAYGGQVRSASLGDRESLRLGSNESFAFRPRCLPLPGDDLGVRLAYAQDDRRVLVTVVPDGPVARVTVREADPPAGGTGLTEVVAGLTLQVGLAGTLELHPADGSAPFEVTYALATTFAWEPSEQTVLRMVIRAVRAMGLTSGGFRPAPLPPRAVTFRVRVSGDAVHELREVPSMCVYAAGPAVPRAGEHGSTFMKLYFFLNDRDCDAAWQQLSAAERATARIAGDVVTVRHFRVGEGSGNTSVLVSAAGTQGVVPVPQDYALNCIVAVSPEIMPWSERTRCPLDGLGGVARGLDLLHADGWVFGDVKADNVCLAQSAVRGTTAASLLDVDSIVRATSPVLLTRRTPDFSLPALLDQDGLSSATVEPALMRANDHFGFVGVVVAARSGTATAVRVLAGGAYTDPTVPEAVRDEVMRAVARLRQLDVGATDSDLPLTCHAWLESLLDLEASTPVIEGRRDPVRRGALPRLLEAVGPYQAYTAHQALEQELERYAQRWLRRTQLTWGSICVVVLLVMLVKGVLL